MTMKRKRFLSTVGSVALVLLWVSFLYAQGEPQVQVGVKQLADNLYMLQDSKGMGNTVLLTGEDGLLLVDTKGGESAPKLFAKIAELSHKPIRFVITTHWHYDHVGGNETAAETGATIIAHENVRKQMGMAHNMKILNVKIPPSPETARPLLTYTKKVTLHINGEDVIVFHVAPGHTDGDSIVYFPKANVIHMADLYFEGFYPYIGIYSGGSIDGMIKVIHEILPMIDENTKVVPGHGPLSDKALLQEYLSMLTAVRDNVKRLLKEGKTMEQVVAAKPTRAFDGKWGKGFLPPDRFAGLVFMDLSPKLP